MVQETFYQTQNETKKASFEEAISVTKFGKFNILLILILIPSAMSPIIDVTMMSFIVPVAHCDLNLSLQEIGLLNASYSIGFIISAYFWGIIADTIGRRYVLLLTYAVDLLINIISPFLKSFWLHFIFKLSSGFFISGAYGLLMPYAAEFHSNKYRSKVVYVVGLSMNFTLTFMPLIAWFVMPLRDLSLNQFDVHSWQLYMAILSIPSLLSTIAYTLLPESPKYLMSVGKNAKALKVFRKIYKINTGKSEDTYQFKELMNETLENNSLINGKQISITQMINKGIIQLKPIWQQPYLGKIMLTIISHFGILLGSNTMRLWLPQLLTSIDEYNQLNRITNSTVCEVIIYSFKNVTMKNDNDTICTVIQSNDLIYINLIELGAVCFAIGIFIIFTIDHFEKNYYLVMLQLIGGCTAFGTYWSTNSIMTFVLLVIYIVFTIQSSIILMSLCVEMFPTNLRAMASSLVIQAGQLGSLVGNLFFPLLLSLGCFIPFAFLGGIVLVSGLLCLFLPKSNKNIFK